VGRCVIRGQLQWVFFGLGLIGKQCNVRAYICIARGYSPLIQLAITKQIFGSLRTGFQVKRLKTHIFYRTTLASYTLYAVGIAVQAFFPQVITTYFCRVSISIVIEVIPYSSPTSSSRFQSTILYF
jgi:hypothetical protein